MYPKTAMEMMNRAVIMLDLFEKMDGLVEDREAYTAGEH